ncbi:molybdenum ABC transporter ATP-binding protein [Lonepinella koalarum]|uniref:Molybdenum ABC transporter ATP-binding protein n=1 Tax=Lonepinella koalarum TaxID=53417 RepID=A0A4R1KNC2_9PAST|nr:molybdenum ABC transporter ATP-binding protein [Lonepinella koalarum]TCK66555.1 molybdenum ABC transporter ATP-binding protein [Lonepinella koalarum]TFJ89022.1 molybdenum ABC transporter ATP-binding protein [Lonepinella koalarum]
MLDINVSKRLGNFELQLNAQIPSQNVTALFGLSGSGKSTVINLISGLIHPDQGYIKLNDKILVDTKKGICLPPNKRNMGYVFQDGRLFPHYSVKGNLRYAMQSKSRKNAVEFDRIVQLLGIEHLLNRYPISLSGGEKQRVAIGRALLSQPEMLLMDEPLSALDLPRKQELLSYLENLAQQIAIPILYVTHSVDELTTLAEQVILMEDGKMIAFDKVDNVVSSSLFERWKG